MRKLELSECVVELKALPEDLDYHKEYDKEVAEDIQKLDNSSEWGWFCAKVIVSWEGLSSDPEYLGGCSYESEEDFRKDPYFDDMCNSALANLNSKLEALYNKLQKLV